MDKRGPYQKVIRAERIGEKGTVQYLVELECEHILKLTRKPPRDRVCCVACTKVVIDEEPVIDMDPLRDAAHLAHKLHVDPSQIDVYPGGAHITLDAFQLRRLLA